MDELLGAGHRAILDRLLRQLRSVQAGDDRAPRVVLLTGPSGAGKSRIVRELYRTLADAQPEPAYWPPLPESVDLGDGSAVDPALAARKVIGPPVEGFVWPAGALPSFTWWDFNCGQIRPGSPVDAVAHAAPAIEIHQLPALLAWRRSASVTQRLGAVKADLLARVREAAAAGGSEAAGLALDAVGLAIPGWGLLVDWLKGAGKAFGRHRSEQAALAQTRTVGAEVTDERGDAVAQVATLVLSSVVADLPAIVVVEDIHLMGAELRRFLEVLAVRRPDKPVLVVATAWPEGDHRPEYRQWRAQAELVGNLAVDEVPELPTDALARFVLAAAPETDPADTAGLTAHFGNPLALQLFLGLRSTRRRITRSGGALVLDAATLGSVDNSIRGLYQQRFEELPPQVQQALSHAAATLPEHSTGTLPYARRVVTDAAVRADFIDADAGAAHDAALADAAGPYGWARPESAGVDRFVEPVLDEIALGHGLDAGDVADLRATTVDVLREAIDHARAGETWFSEDTLTPEVRHAAGWLVGLLPSAPVTGVVDAVAVLLVADSYAEVYQFGAAVNLVFDHDALDALPYEDVGSHLWMACVTGWTGRAGRPDLAVTLARMALELATEAFGENDLMSLEARERLAAWTGHLGRTDQAVVELAEVLRIRSAADGPDDPQTLATRARLAVALRDVGRLAEACAEFESVLDAYTLVLGADHPDTLDVRKDLARTIGLRGDSKAAVAALTALHGDSAAALGAGHPQTLGVVGELGHWLAESGSATDAVEPLERLAAQSAAALGDLHPESLILRGEAARMLGNAGRPDESARALRAVIDDAVPVFTRTHPSVLTMRNNLAVALKESGRGAEAIIVHRELQADIEQHLGPDHPQALLNRYNLGLSHKEVGEVEVGAAIIADLLPDQLRILGADHPETLKVRGSLAFSAGELGRPDEAVRLLTELIDDRARVLGPAHPLTLGARGSRGYWLREAGDHEEAEAAYRSTVADTVAALGADHPQVLTLRSALASLASDRGESSTALAEYAELLEMRRRALGADHPLTLQSRSNWIIEVGKSGRLLEAIDLNRELLLDQERVLQHDHPQLLATLENLAHQNAEAGVFDEAVANGVRLLTLRDDPTTLAMHYHLGSWLGELDDHAGAAAHLRTYQKDSGTADTSDESSAALAYLIAYHLAEAEDPEAVDAYRAALEAYAAVVGVGHPDELQVRRSYASLLEVLCEVDAAIDEYTVVLAGRRATHEPGAPEIAESEADLAGALAHRADHHADERTGEYGDRP